MKSVLLSLTFLVGGSALAQEVVEKAIVVSSPLTEAPAARKEMQEQAVNQVTEDLAKEMMGSEKYEKQKTQVLNKVTKLSGRYIPYVKPGEMKALQPGPGFNMDFVMKVSPLNLKTILQKLGFLNENDTVPVVLPLIRFHDRVDVNVFKWWQSSDATSKKFLITQARQVEASLSQAFKKQNFHVLRPIENSLSPLVPTPFQSERLSPEDKDFLGQLFQAPLVIDGEVEMARSPSGSNVYKIEIKLSAIQLSNNRTIAEISRKYETDSGLFEVVAEKKLKQNLEALSQDLASQVFDAWQKGTVGTNTLRITFRGFVPIQQREALKEKIQTQVSAVKNIRERLVSSDYLSYEVDSTIAPQELGQKLGQVAVGDLKFSTPSVNDKELVIDIRR